MNITYDKIAGALYIQLNDRKIVSTKDIFWWLNIDFDENGEIVGIELL